jgi:hypothetical protein
MKSSGFLDARGVPRLRSFGYHPSRSGTTNSEGTVHNAEQQTETSRVTEVLFPVAVGGVFLIVLVVGALLG